jgi:hypothetical protein
MINPHGQKHKNFALRHEAWGAERLRPPKKAHDKLVECPLFRRWTALDSKSESEK